MAKLRYNPIFVPGDMIEIEEIDGRGLVISTKLCSALEEELAGKQYRYYSVIYYRENQFVFGEFDEMFLEKTAKKIQHYDTEKCMYHLMDIQQVLNDNLRMILELGVNDSGGES